MEGAVERVPMIGGMVSSTLLTLIVIPGIYSLIKGWRIAFAQTSILVENAGRRLCPEHLIERVLSDRRTTKAIGHGRALLPSP